MTLSLLLEELGVGVSHGSGFGVLGLSRFKDGVPAILKKSDTDLLARIETTDPRITCRTTGAKIERAIRIADFTKSHG